MELRTFKNIGQGKCVICNSSDDGECILIPIIGTEKDSICEAKPLHLHCLNLSLSEEQNIMFQRIKEDV